MQGMADSPTARLDAEHDAEVAKQAEIAAAVEQAAAGETSNAPVVDETSDAPIADTRPQVTLRSVNVEQYPLTVTLVGSEPLVFESESAIVEVTPEVAEQIAYSPVVEVAE